MSDVFKRILFLARHKCHVSLVSAVRRTAGLTTRDRVVDQLFNQSMNQTKWNS